MALKHKKKSFKHYYQQIPKRIIYFIVVGSLSALTHCSLVFLLVSQGVFLPLRANVLAFMAAFCVSYWGHSRYTFDRAATDFNAMFKFFLVAAFSFMLNQSLYALLLEVFHLNYLIALMMVLFIVPGLTYLLSSRWAFRQKNLLRKDSDY